MVGIVDLYGGYDGLVWWVCMVGMYGGYCGYVGYGRYRMVDALMFCTPGRCVTDAYHEHDSGASHSSFLVLLS